MSMSNSIQAASAKFEAARLIHDAKYEHAHEVYEEVQAILGERPERCWAGDETRAGVARWEWWNAQRLRQVVARLGTDEDEYIAPHRDRMESAQGDLAKIEATSHDELLCQLRAWWSVEECCVNETSSEGRMIVRLLKDLERLSKTA